MNTTIFNIGYAVIMNVTSEDGGVKTEYNWPVLFLLPIVIFGVAGNILVCMAVSMEKRLQSVTNYFLLSLAITDLLVCLVVWPFSMLMEFMGYWPLDVILCDIFITSDVLVCTSSILHLCTISLERYIAIRSPLSSRTRSKTTVRIKIALVWVTSLAISSPIMILGIVDDKNILNKDQCVLSNNDFIIYGSVSAFFIPLGIMCIFFGFTIRLLRGQWKMCDPNRCKEGELNMRRSKSGASLSFRKRFKQNGKSQARRTRSCPERTQRSPKSINDSDPNISCDTPQRQLKPLLSKYKYTGNNVTDSNPSMNEAPVSPTESQTSSEYRMDFEYLRQHSSPIDENDEFSTTPPRSYSTETTVTRIQAVSDTTESEKCLDGIVKNSDVNENEPIQSPVTKTFSAPSRLHELVRKHHSIMKSTSSFISKKDSVKQKQVKNNVKTEQKASKTLGILFATFVICWGPFFIVNILTALCSTCQFDHLMVTIFVWLGFVSSTLNPIIYTVFNKTFRTTFIKLLKCQYRTIQKPMRIKAICVGINSRDGGTLHLPL